MPTISKNNFSDLRWESRFVDTLPGDPEPLNFTRPVEDVCYSLVQPTPVKAPRLIAWSEALGNELGIGRPNPEDQLTAEVLGGNRVLPGMKPYAARYGGHQFGHWAGQLGDGRAITLGEVDLGVPGRHEFQLKGAGPTPYSRRADGRAVLRSSIREFLCSEAMHFLGVPTTRALSLVATGDEVVRDLFYDGNPKAEPGAIVCRVAPSFLRFGNFQILAAHEEHDLLKKLTDFLISEHYPELRAKFPESSPEIYGQLLDEIARRTALMIAHWMRVGFVHGVMNTDNMSALGLTIDYGPYGWLEPYEPGWTPNTTDAQGRRYRFGHQPNIALWNIAHLAEAWMPLIQDEARVHRSLEIYRDTFEDAYERILAQKIGLSALDTDEDQKLVQDMFQLLQSSETDYTLFFRNLADWNPKSDSWQLVAPALYASDLELNGRPGALLREGWALWFQKYSTRLARESLSDVKRSALMKQVNPKYVLRNYLAQNAITAAEKGDLSVLERLLRVLKTPYDELPGEEELSQKRPEWARNAPGCSALSCSS